MMKDHFADKAGDWDKISVRKSTPEAIAKAIKSKINLTKEMQVMDFGVGTGLLGFIIAQDVKEVWGVDMSPSMLAKLEEKNTPDLHIKAIHQDIVKNPIQKVFDGIVSSMTLHHVQNIEDFFKTIYNNISEGGFLAIADLEKEDGTFHTNNEGVFHFGFEQTRVTAALDAAGFTDIAFEKVTTIKKPQRDFGVFLVSARK